MPPLHTIIETKPSLSFQKLATAVFAKVALRKGLSLGPYTGERLTYDQVMPKPMSERTYILYKRNGNTYLDGSNGGNLLSRVNSPYGTNRVAHVKLTQNGTFRVTKNIAAGQELFIRSVRCC